ncbi:MAG TPA: hypothetical protein VHY20_03390, partial [Pirellulales bacterium]|nr:hypothetical protein [Pirellulales bacterium]
MTMHSRSAQNSLPVWPAAIWFAVGAALVFAAGPDGVYTGEGLYAAERVSFRHDVMAVLSKAGCNQG